MVIEIIEQSQVYQERFNQLALQRQLDSMPKGESATECENCGDDIPEDRRKAYPGCKRCISCQQQHERDQRNRR